MPLIYKADKKSVSKNIETEIAAGKTRAQAIAIALSIKEKVLAARKRKHKAAMERKNECQQIKYLKCGVRL